MPTRDDDPDLVHLVSSNLRDLTRTLSTTHGYPTGTGLGGNDGYGVEFTNDTFEFHPYYWGDCTCGRDTAEAAWDDTHDHAPTCYQQVIRERGFLDFDTPTTLTHQQVDAHNRAITDAVCAEMGLDPTYGSAVHCTCTHNTDYATWVEAHPHDDTTCGIGRPNFRHKPTGATVTWYKYIGRGMVVTLPEEVTWDAVYADTVASLPAPTP